MLPAWVWFLIAVVAAVGGGLLLLAERRSSGGSVRGRRRWAEQKNWEFVEVDPDLPGRWHHGSIAQGGPGRALELATGAVPGPGGRRLAHVFDHEQAGQVTGIIAAVRGVAALPVAVELRLPSAPLPDDAGLESLGQVGDRYAFVDSIPDARPLMTPDVARAADEVGDDIPLLWAEDAWVLASAPSDASTDRVQELLQSLVEVSAALEEAGDVGAGGAGDHHDRDRAHDDHDDDTDHHGDDLDGHDLDDHGDLDVEPDDGWSPSAMNARGKRASGDDPAADGIEDAEIVERPSAPRQTHRDRPGDIPYDVEDDEPGARSGSSRGR